MTNRARSLPRVLVFESGSARVNSGSVKRLAESVLKAEKWKAAGFLSIILTGNKDIRRLNARYLGKNRVTDVIAFPLDGFTDDPADGPMGHPWNRRLNRSKSCVGEIYISIDQSVRQAKTYGISPEEELSRLVIHGILHLSGYDDGDREEKDEMRKREDWHLGKGNWIKMKKEWVIGNR
jgi:probable rRNA maturation factor